VAAGAVQQDLQKLALAAHHRQQQAFRPGTHANHDTQIRGYLAFCHYYQLTDIEPEPSTICLYIEFLARQFSSPKSIKNYIHGISYLHKVLDLTAPALESFPVQLSLRTLTATMPQLPHQRRPIKPEMLIHLCSLSDQQGGTFGLAAKCAILFAFFGLLRCSSLAPHSAAAFNPRQHICRGDIIVEHPGLLIFIKWSKSRQESSYFHLLPIPSLDTHQLCPLQAYKTMISVQPASANSPLLHNHNGSPITTSQLRQYLRSLLQAGGYSCTQYSFHGLRRGGATFAYRLGQGLAAIKQQGDWRSDAVHRYIESHFGDPALPLAMASAITAGHF